MKTCRKCKEYLEEKDWELWIVHRWSSHGTGVEDLKTLVKEKTGELNEDWIQELIKKHKITGKAGEQMFKK